MPGCLACCGDYDWMPLFLLSKLCFACMNVIHIWPMIKGYTNVINYTNTIEFNLIKSQMYTDWLH